MAYRTNHLSVDEKKELCRKAHEVCSDWWVDILDIKTTGRRRRIAMSLDDILAKLNETSHFVVIHRNYPPENHLEIGFRTMDTRDADYFLWIQLDAELIPEFTKNLQG